MCVPFFHDRSKSTEIGSDLMCDSVIYLFRATLPSFIKPYQTIRSKMQLPNSRYCTGMYSYSQNSKDMHQIISFWQKMSGREAFLLFSKLCWTYNLFSRLFPFIYFSLPVSLSRSADLIFFFFFHVKESGSLCDCSSSKAKKGERRKEAELRRIPSQESKEGALFWGYSTMYSTVVYWKGLSEKKERKRLICWEKEAGKSKASNVTVVGGPTLHFSLLFFHLVTKQIM